MTREEAIECLKTIQRWTPDWDDREDGLSYWDAIDMALSALRPVSREQVERLWPGCDRCKAADTAIAWERWGHQYCSQCGRPLTPEAWEELRKRLEELKEYIKKTDLTAVERGALLQAISNMSTLTPPNEPLTQADLDSMDYDKVWIDYGDDGEWALVVNGRIYCLAVLEGAGFEDILREELGGETLDRPSGDYTVYRRPPEGEEERHGD